MRWHERVAVGAIFVTLPPLVAGCGETERGDPGAIVDQWRVEETLRVGSVDDPAESLTRVVGPVIGPDGRIYVGQPMLNEVRIFDKSGHFLGVAGGEGDGPGEFGSPIVVLGIRGDSLLAVDFSGRMGFFSPEGAPLSTVTFQASLGDNRPLPTVVTGLLSDGSVVATRAMAPGEPLIFLHLERTGELIDTLFVGSSSSIPMNEGGLAFSIRDPFPTQPLFVLDARHGRTAVVERAPALSSDLSMFRVTKRSIEGDTLYSRSYGYMPIPITGEASASAIARTVQPLLRIQPDSRRAEVLVRKAVTIPAFYVSATKALFAEDGGIWIEMGGPEGVEKTWRIHDESGTPVGEVAVPAQADVRYVQDDAIWAVITDELDVPFIVRYSIVKSDGAGEKVSS